MRQLAVSGVIGGLGAGFAAVFGWARIKGLAVGLGPAELGVYGQLWAIVLYGGLLGALGTGVAITALIASEREGHEVASLRTAALAATFLPFACGLGLLALLAAALSPTSDLFRVSDSWLLLLAAVSLPFVAVQAALQHVLQGLEDVRGQTVSYTIYSAGFAALSVVGALTIGLAGAVAALTLGNLLLAWLYWRRTHGLIPGPWRRGDEEARRLRRSFERRLLRTGLAALGVTAVFAAADLAVRTAVIHQSGRRDAGLWFGLLTVSVQFIGVLAGAFSYLLPSMTARAGANADRASAARSLDDACRLTLVVVLPTLAVISALREPFVSLVFSHEFAEMAGYLPVQLFGDAFRSVGWALGVALVPLGLIRSWAIIGIASSIVFGIAGVLLVHSHGVAGAADAWTLMWGSSLVATAGVLVSKVGWRPSPRLAVGFLTGLLALGVASLHDAWVRAPLALVLSCAVVVIGTRPAERAALQRWLKRRWAAIR
jgi:antigen flippase